MVRLESRDGVVFLPVKVVPGASRTRCMGILGGRLKIAVGDAPEKGKANAELTAFLAKQLGLRRRDVSVNQGLTTAIKVIRIENTDEQHVRRALGLDEAE